MTAVVERLITQLASGAINPDALSRSDQAAIYRFCWSTTSRKQGKIVDEIKKQRSRVAQRKQNELLRCLPVRLLAASIAIRKMKKRRLLRQTAVIPFSQVWHLADDLRRNMCSPSFGCARLKPKGAGYREVVQFELFDVARQLLIAMSIRPFVRLQPVQYVFRGGRKAACEELLEALTQAPISARVIHVDITNFYGSIRRQWLRENLPLPAAIIRQLVFPHVLRWHLGLAHPLNDEGTEESDRWGIPQGSVVSSIIAEFVMASVLQAGADLLEGLRCFNYSDNLAVMGVLVPGDLDVAAFMERLAEVFLTHRAGPFHLRLVSVSNVTEPFRFLGYHFQKTADGSRAFLPGPVALAREMNYERDMLEAETVAELLRVEHAARSYCASFRLWEGAAQMEARLLEVSAGHRAHLIEHSRHRIRQNRSGKLVLPQ